MFLLLVSDELAVAVCFRCDAPVSVTRLQWYDEDKCFAIAFSDGLVSLSTKDGYVSPIIIDAHKVTCNEYSSSVSLPVVWL